MRGSAVRAGAGQVARRGRRRRRCARRRASEDRGCLNRAWARREHRDEWCLCAPRPPATRIPRRQAAAARSESAERAVARPRRCAVISGRRRRSGRTACRPSCHGRRSRRRGRRALRRPHASSARAACRSRVTRPVAGSNASTAADAVPAGVEPPAITTRRRRLRRPHSEAASAGGRRPGRWSRAASRRSCPASGCRCSPPTMYAVPPSAAPAWSELGAGRCATVIGRPGATRLISSCCATPSPPPKR